MFTFEQLINACKSRSWVDRPFILSNTEYSKIYGDSKAEELSSEVDCFMDTFDLKAFLESVTEKEIMFLPTLGYCKFKIKSEKINRF